MSTSNDCALIVFLEFNKWFVDYWIEYKFVDNWQRLLKIWRDFHPQDSTEL